MSQTAVPPRSEIALEHTWNAESIFESPQAWEAEYNRVDEVLATVTRFQGRLGDGPTVLADFFDALNELHVRVGRLYIYGYMSAAVDTNDQQAAGLADRGRGLMGRAYAAVAFAQPELLAVGRAALDAWLAAEPRLSVYTHYIDDLFRQQAHVRSAEVEELLGLLRGPFLSIENTADVLVDAELPFTPARTSGGEEVPVAQGNIDFLLNSPDRTLRRTAYESYADGYLAFKNTLAGNLSLSIQRDVFLARARRYGSSLEAALFKDNIPLAVYHNLVDTFRRHLPIWHRYWAVRRRVLGVETLHPYDVWAPLTDHPPTVPYQQAVDWVVEALAPLGEDYVRVLRRGCLADRWVDVYPNLGKRQGAFSYGSPGTLPFIVMSYGEDVGSLSTLAHETGHSMHSYLAWEAQPPLYGEYSMAVAEVASNFHQAMLRAHLLAHYPDRDLQIALIEDAMTYFHRYLFIMPTLARFELETHRRAEDGEALTADGMTDLLADLFAEGYGGEMAFDRERVGIRWAQFTHLYVAFYTFQYATGISAAQALAQRILDGVPGAAAAYVQMLRTGGAAYPLDALRQAGVDLATPQPVEAGFAMLSALVDRLEELAG